MTNLEGASMDARRAFRKRNQIWSAFSITELEGIYTALHTAGFDHLTRNLKEEIQRELLIRENAL